MFVVSDDEFVIYGPGYGSLLPNHTFGQVLLESLLSTNGDEIAIEDAFTGRNMTYKTLLEEVCNLAEALRIYGYPTGTVISVSSENNLEFFIPVLASLLIGCIVIPVNHNYTHIELNHIMKISKPRLVFCSSNIATRFANIRRDLTFIEKIIVIDSSIAHFANSDIQILKEYVSNALRGIIVCPNKFQPLVGDPAKLGAFILCSSGTTGMPKGVLLSHLNIVVKTIHSRSNNYYSTDKTEFGILPFFHGFGLNCFLSSLINKSKIIVMKHFDEDIFLKCIQDHKIKSLIIAPPTVVLFEKSPKVLKYDLSSIEDIICGAAPLSRHTEIAVKKRLVNLKAIRQGYGLSETTLAVTMVPKDDERPGSSGKVVPFMACKIMNSDTEKSLGPNQVGEVCVKGPLVMMGYYDNEKATKETFTPDGWLKTGDLGYYDNDEYVYIVDRLKEVIKYKGFQVAPAELEALLLKHSKIRDVGVVGLPDELAGELPLAFVVKQDGVHVTDKELHLHINSMVSPQKYLRGGIIFVSEIPRTASGKILRRELKERLRDFKHKIETKL